VGVGQKDPGKKGERRKPTPGITGRKTGRIEEERREENAN